MAANPTVSASIARRLSITQLESDLEAATDVFLNSATVSRHCEGLSLTVDKANAEGIIETLEEAISIKRAISNGCDPALSQPSLAVSVDRRGFRIY